MTRNRNLSKHKLSPMNKRSNRAEHIRFKSHSDIPYTSNNLKYEQISAGSNFLQCIVQIHSRKRSQWQ